MVDEVLQPVLQKARSSSSSSSSCVPFHLPATPTMLYVSTQQFTQTTLTAQTQSLTITMTLPMTIEMHADERRGTMDISDIGREALIH